MNAEKGSDIGCGEEMKPGKKEIWTVWSTKS